MRLSPLLKVDFWNVSSSINLHFQISILSKRFGENIVLSRENSPPSSDLVVSEMRILPLTGGSSGPNVDRITGNKTNPWKTPNTTKPKNMIKTVKNISFVLKASGSVPRRDETPPRKIEAVNRSTTIEEENSNSRNSVSHEGAYDL